MFVDALTFTLAQMAHTPCSGVLMPTYRGACPSPLTIRVATFRRMARMPWTGCSCNRPRGQTADICGRLLGHIDLIGPQLRISRGIVSGSPGQSRVVLTFRGAVSRYGIRHLEAAQAVRSGRYAGQLMEPHVAHGVPDGGVTPVGSARSRWPGHGVADETPISPGQRHSAALRRCWPGLRHVRSSPWGAARASMTDPAR